MNKTIRTKVLNKYKKRCAYCGGIITLDTMEVDHVIPKSLCEINGLEKNDVTNLNPSCSTCNKAKSNMSLNQYRKFLKDYHNQIKQQHSVMLAAKYGMIKLEKFTGLFYFEKLKRRKYAVRYNSTRTSRNNTR